MRRPVPAAKKDRSDTVRIGSIQLDGALGDIGDPVEYLRMMARLIDRGGQFQTLPDTAVAQEDLGAHIIGQVDLFPGFNKDRISRRQSDFAAFLTRRIAKVWVVRS